MKPFPSAPLTAEDVEIWNAVALVAAIRHGAQCLWDWSEITDRCDAELMWHLARGALMQQDLGDGANYFQARGPRNWHLYKATPLGEVPI